MKGEWAASERVNLSEISNAASESRASMYNFWLTRAREAARSLASQFSVFLEHYPRRWKWSVLFLLGRSWPGLIFRRLNCSCWPKMLVMFLHYLSCSYKSIDSSRRARENCSLKRKFWSDKSHWVSENHSKLTKTKKLIISELTTRLCFRIKKWILPSWPGVRDKCT